MSGHEWKFWFRFTFTAVKNWGGYLWSLELYLENLPTKWILFMLEQKNRNKKNFIKYYSIDG